MRARPHAALNGLMLLGMLALLVLRAPQLLASLNADSYYMECLWRDLALSHVPLSYWCLPPAPSLFPDLPLYGLCRLVGQGPGPAYALYSIFSTLLLTGSFYLLARQLPGARRHALRISLAASLGLLLIIPLGSPIPALFQPAFHASSLILGLVMLALALASARAKLAWGWMALGWALALLGSFSDLALAALFILPLALASIISRITKAKARLPLVFPLGAGLASLAGAGCLALVRLRILTPFHAQRVMGLWELPRPLAQIAITSRDLLAIARAQPALALVALAWLLLALLRWRKARGRAGRSRWQVAGFFMLCLGLDLVLPFFSANSADARYLLPLLAVPLFLLACYPPPLPRLKAWLWALAACLFLSEAGLAWQALPAWSSAFELKAPEEQAWLESLVQRYGLHHGYCGYWQEKPLRVCSQGRLQLAALDWSSSPACPLVPLFLICNNAWHRGPGIDDFPCYDYVLADGLDPARLRATFGEPAVVESWGAHQAWVYNRPQDIICRNFLRKFLSQEGPGPTALVAQGMEPLSAASARSLLSMQVQPGSDAFVQFDPPAQAQVLELWGWSQDSWDLQLMGSQGKLLQRLHLSSQGGSAPAIWYAPVRSREPIYAVRLLPRQAAGFRGLLAYPDAGGSGPGL